MNKDKKSTKPWLDHRGRELPTEQLKEISKCWDNKTWQRYADSLEIQPEGKILKPGEFRKIQDQQTKNIFSINGESTSAPMLVECVKKAVSRLSKRQREVVDSMFYGGKSIEETALELGLSKPTVYEYKKQALAKLKGVLSVSPNAVAVYEGVSELMTSDRSPDEDLLEVMNEDICRGDLSMKTSKKAGQP